jgi:hypothetical protein
MTPAKAIETADGKGWCMVRSGLWVWTRSAIMERLDVKSSYRYFAVSDQFPAPLGIRGPEDKLLIELMEVKIVSTL